MPDIGGSLLAGQRYSQNFFSDRRKTEAYNALRQVYGPIAGDPDSALKLQSYGQSEESFPLEQQNRQLTNQRSQQVIGQSAEQFPLEQQARQLGNAGAAAEQARQGALSAAITLKDLASKGASAEQIGQAYDQIVVPNAQAFGLDPAHVAPLRQAIVQDPAKLDAIIKGLQAPTALQQQSTRWQVVTKPDGTVWRLGPNGEAEQVMGQDGNPLVASQPVQANRRLEQADDRLDPNRVGARAQAAGRGTAIGRDSGEAAAGLPVAEAFQQSFNDRVTQIITPERETQFQSIFGAPSLKGFLSHGGLGAAGEIWGTDAADAASDLKMLVGDVQRVAYESLRGGGAITEAERTAIAQAYANLERSQSWDNFKVNLKRYQDSVALVLDAQRKRAGTGAPSAPDAAPQADPADDVVDFTDYFK